MCRQSISTSTPLPLVACGCLVHTYGCFAPARTAAMAESDRLSTSQVSLWLKRHVDASPPVIRQCGWRLKAGLSLNTTAHPWISSVIRFCTAKREPRNSNPLVEEQNKARSRSCSAFLKIRKRLAWLADVNFPSRWQAVGIILAAVATIATTTPQHLDLLSSFLLPASY